MESQIEIYKSPDSEVEIEVQLVNETVWLNRHKIALLFGRDLKTIGKHINNIFSEDELEEHAVVAKFATTVQD